MLDQVEEGLLGPLNVVEDTDEGRLLLEQLAERPSDLVGRPGLVRLTEQRTKRRRGFGIGRKDVELLQHFAHRPVGDPLAIGKTSSAHHPRIDLGQELGSQPRLADPGVADDRDEPGALVRARFRPGLSQSLQLACPADEPGFVPPLGRVADADEPKGRHGVCLPFQLERLDRLGLDRGAHEREGVGAEEDLARLGGLLQAGGDVDRVAGGQAFLGSGHDLARIHADARLDAELRQSVAHLDRGPAGTQRIVLVHLRHAEHGHDCVADELLHSAAVQFDDAFHPLEVAGEDGPERLRVGRLAERSRTGHVAEENGDGLALLARGRGSLERGAAGVAEASVLRIWLPAARTREHGAPPASA